jgi:hypothetical protein
VRGTRRSTRSRAWLSSDIVYPAGGIEEYARKVLWPYADYHGPIFAIPGNHDWYDDGDGFMYWFCGARERPRPVRRRPLSRTWLREQLWRRSPQASAKRLANAPALRRSPRQPGPYFALDAGPLRLLCIDAGLGGPLDRAQAKWLRRMASESHRPKLLLTGRPLFADGRERMRPIEGGGTINEIVADPAHGFIATIGGDTHNYQRYLLRRDDKPDQVHLVSGGGGAFTHGTHTIPRLRRAKCGVDEDDFRCYPLRGDSLARYSDLYAQRLGSWARIAPDEAASILASRLRIAATRASARSVKPSAEGKRAARLILSLPDRPRGPLRLPMSELLDWNEPPMFKHFLKVDGDRDRITIRCYAVTGCLDAEKDPPVEDALTASRGPDGSWTWEPG